MRKITVRRILVALVLAGAVGSAGCETVKGAGQDIEDAGEAMEDAVD